MLLYPDVGLPTIDDRIRFEQSLRVFALFTYLDLPVEVIWTRPPSCTRPQAEWTVDADFFPRWEVGANDRHAFLFGIVDRLWDGLEFPLEVPPAFASEWEKTVGSECEDDEPKAHRKSDRLFRNSTPRRIQHLFRKGENTPAFEGLPLPTADTEHPF